MTVRVRAVLALAASLIAGAAAAAPPPPPSCVEAAEKSDPDPVVRFRCASEFNLRAMIADPADLERGRNRTPDPGDAAFQAVHRHRIGELKSLDVEEKKTPMMVIEKAGK